MNTCNWLKAPRVLLAAGTLVLACPSVQAAELCVNSSGKGGCSTTISAAVAAAAPNDVIRVAKGTYHENVVIRKPLSLLGENPETTIIDATNLLNAINVDGFTTPTLP